jgi:hypothetical protein
MPNPRNFKSHKQMGTCTLVWANIQHPEINTEKEAAAKFHRKHSPSYTKRLTSLAWPTFVLLHPYTAKCTFHFSLHVALVLLLSELYCYCLNCTVLSELYCYCPNCTVTVRTVLLLSKLYCTVLTLLLLSEVYSYCPNCTVTVRTVLLLSVLYCYCPNCTVTV